LKYIKASNKKYLKLYIKARILIELVNTSILKNYLSYLSYL